MRSLLEISRELASIAQAGATYSRDSFDLERFRRLHEIAGEMLGGAVGDASCAWPVQIGYLTPKVDVRAVVFQEDSVLLVQEAATGKWTVPGGWADVNLTPAENAEKECLEESGYLVRATALTSLLDRDRAGYPSHPESIYKIFFLCETLGGGARPSNESLDVRFFSLAALPELDTNRVRLEDIRQALAFRSHPASPALFQATGVSVPDITS